MFEFQSLPRHVPMQVFSLIRVKFCNITPISIPDQFSYLTANYTDITQTSGQATALGWLRPCVFSFRIKPFSTNIR